MGPAHPSELELLNFSFFLANCSDRWKKAPGVQQREAVLSEARQMAREKPGLVKFLPGWISKILPLCDSRPASPRHASSLAPNSQPGTISLGGFRLKSTHASAPVPAPGQESYSGTRLAYGGPQSIQAAAKRRSRKARLAARAPAAMAPCSSTGPHSHGSVLQYQPTQPWIRVPVPCPAAMVPATEPAHTAIVPAQVQAPAAMVPATEPAHTAMVPAPALAPAAMVPVPAAMVPASVPAPGLAYRPTPAPRVLSAYRPTPAPRLLLALQPTPAPRVLSAYRPTVMYLNAFNERSFMNVFIFWANVN
ncbi:hypothetical protein CesoFtcFv8_005255 [Champsocephalus esox]|uniref:Uncharacterized protein n=1 Tax=Champsocephalus esox TaxID=159716 RepID=A0AAN8H9U6_9TELE|nr:hypothetical protein CesoFtcFv8_005255 [Champsocephalus esox]